MIYVISFFAIGLLWVGNHVRMSRTWRCSRGLASVLQPQRPCAGIAPEQPLYVVALSIVELAVVAFIPFAASVLVR